MIKIDLNKAKEIVHSKRREKRNDEFAPLDIEATIPAKAAQAEASRQAIRDKYSEIQIAIDSAVDVETLKQVMDTL